MSFEERIASAQRSESETTQVALSIPADPRFLVLARMATSAIAAQLALGLDAIEDLRLAIDELCIGCSSGAEQSTRIDLQFSIADDSLTVFCTAQPVADDIEPSENQALLSPSALSGRILEALTDSYGIEQTSHSVRRGWFHKARDGQG